MLMLLRAALVAVAATALVPLTSGPAAASTASVADGALTITAGVGETNLFVLTGLSGGTISVSESGSSSLVAGAGRDEVRVQDGERDGVDCGSTDDRVTRDLALDVLTRCG